ncbi:unnamed protein product [Meloidogyne enterolobii]|uniref:Uncharacterized protein n=1 Tax=Meloidogyne enterolobii TaxID=390850 RepID=A0ACB0ZZI3_MELEN
MGKIIEDTHKNSEAKREDTILAKDVNKNKGKNVELTITCHGIKVKCEINEEKLFSGNLCEIGVMLFSKEEKKVYFHINDVDGYELDYSEGIGSSTSGGKH